jgi:hypothetical protein
MMIPSILAVSQANATEFPGQCFNTEMVQHGFNRLKHHHVLFWVHFLTTGFSDDFLSSGDLTLLNFFLLLPMRSIPEEIRN